jgi:DNA polymerase
LSKVLIDFETHYDDEYSLKKLSVEAYVNDPKFEVLCMGYIDLDKGIPHKVVWGAADARQALLELRVQDPDTYTYAHNMAFDGYIANKILGPEYKIANPICTVGMAKWHGLARVAGASLANLIDYAFKDVKKGNFLTNHKGLTLKDYSSDPALSSAMEKYCLNDVDITKMLIWKIERAVPDAALEMIAMSIRMYIEPVLELDLELLEKYRSELIARQEECFESMQKFFGLDDREHFLELIRSKDNFVMLLEKLKAPIPMKKSEAKAAKIVKAIAEGEALVKKHQEQGELNTREMRRLRACRQAIKLGDMIPALAKTDLEFMDLMNSEDERVALLCQLRAENNSSIAMSRCETLIDIAKRNHTLPVPLAPFRALTGRYTAGVESDSKSDGVNLQNLPKRSGDKTLRRAIKAPAGYKLVAGDSAQIEARVGAWIAGEEQLVELFRAGGDPYVDMAATIYGEDYNTILCGAKITKDPVYVNMRNVGKETILSSQYGIGGQTFGTRLLQKEARLAATNEEHYAEAKRIISLYRGKYKALTKYRYGLNDALECAVYHTEKNLKLINKNLSDICSVGRDLFRLEVYSDCTVVWFPNDYKLVYANLRRNEDGEFVYDHWHYGRKEVKKIYGGSLFNNITQGLSFAILWEQALKINKFFKVIANVHDSWIAIVKESAVEEAKDYIHECLTTTPDWAKDLPLDASVDDSYNYEIA